MEGSAISPGVIGAAIAIITMLIMVGFIRFLANAIIVIVFLFAAVLPFAFEGQIENGILYAYSCAIGIFAVLFTTPLWGISTIMQKASSGTDETKILELKEQVEAMQKFIESNSQP